MNLPKLAIDRPVFMSCAVILIVVLGIMGYFNLGVDQYPDVNLPVVMVSVPYKGAGPEEIETLVTKPLEDVFSTLQGLKSISVVNQEGFAVFTCQFTMETDSKDAEQRIRDKISTIRALLPKDIDEPVIQRFDPADIPIVIVAVTSDLQPTQAYDYADNSLKPLLSQASGVGSIYLVGGEKREIQVELDRRELNRHQISVSSVAAMIASNGQNVPIGKVKHGPMDLLLRSMGEFRDLDRLSRTVVNFIGSDVAVPLSTLGKVVDGVAERQNYSFVNGREAMFLVIFKQSGANTVEVVDKVLKRVKELGEQLKDDTGHPRMQVVMESANEIRMMLDDVKMSIFLGIILTILVVFLFLGSVRSTLITVTALPVSLLGAFILMNAMNFTINMLTLFALSLAVGLLIDDAIVVRENIWRHIEEGEPPHKAALSGTLEVALAVMATTSVIIAVFMPIAFLKGMVGQFFKQFGMTVCFAMAVSLFEAMTMGPMLSAYWATAKGLHGQGGKGPINKLLCQFELFQEWLVEFYEKTIRWCLKHRLTVILGAVGLSLLSLLGVYLLNFTLVPNMDKGQFTISIKAAPGTNLDAMKDWVLKVDTLIRKHPEVESVSSFAGDFMGGETNTGLLFIKMIPAAQRRHFTTSDLKAALRKELKPYQKELNPQMQDNTPLGDQAPFTLNLKGNDYEQLIETSNTVMEKLKALPGLVDLTTNYDGKKDEFQVRFDPRKMQTLGVMGATAGQELRDQVYGDVPAKFRVNGSEYDIRVQLQEDQRDLQKDFDRIYVPNQNFRMVKLSDVAEPVMGQGPSKINHYNRQRYIQISGQLGKGGALGNILSKAKEIMKQTKLALGITYEFVGQAEDLNDMITSLIEAVLLALVFSYLVLSSLYESPITPFTIMIAIPFALIGALGALILTHQTIDMMTLIAFVMLLGLVTKNSILLVDYILIMRQRGYDRTEAIVQAGRIRLRPILMTTIALICGMLPLVFAFTEIGTAKQPMGIAMEGGLISSLFLTLLVVPALYGYVDDFRLWLTRCFSFMNEQKPANTPAGKKAKRAEKNKF